MNAQAHLNLSLPARPEAVRVARHALAGIDALLGPGVHENLELLVSELVSNSVRHSHSESVDVTIDVASPTVRVEVSDSGPGFEPLSRAPADDATHGWGLFLVQEVAERWGVTQREDRNRVWFELARSPAASPHSY